MGIIIFKIFFKTGETAKGVKKSNVENNVKKFRYVKGSPSSDKKGEKLITFYNTDKLKLHYYNFSYFKIQITDRNKKYTKFREFQILVFSDFNTEWSTLSNNFYKGFTPFSKSGLNFADIAVFGLNQGNTHLTHLLI